MSSSIFWNIIHRKNLPRKNVLNPVQSLSQEVRECWVCSSITIGYFPNPPPPSASFVSTRSPPPPASVLLPFEILTKYAVCIGKSLGRRYGYFATFGDPSKYGGSPPWEWRVTILVWWVTVLREGGWSSREWWATVLGMIGDSPQDNEWL